MKNPLITLATVTAVGALSLGVAAPAMAQSDTATTEATTTESVTIDGLRARCDEAIDRRLDDLAKAQARVQSVDVLTDDHEATIDDIIDRTQVGLTALQNQLEAATDRAEVVRLCARIAPDFRVYLVVLPQTHLTVAADRSQAAVVHGRAILDTLDEAIDRAAGAGIDTAEAQAFRDSALVHLDAANTANDGVADAVLAVTPAGFNGGDGAAVLDGARSDLRETRDELQAAGADVRAAVAALRDAIG